MPTQSDRVELLSVSPIRRIAALLDRARAQRNLISLAGGAPNLPPPPELLKEITRLTLEDPVKAYGYTGTRGIPELRQAISEDLKGYGGVEYDPNREILITHGGTEAIYAVFASILNKNDEVILVDPTYLGYKEAIIVNGGRVRWLPVRVDDAYQPHVEDLKHLITNRTKGFLLVSPDNPTGRIIDHEFAQALADLAEEHDFWIITDEAYKHIVYEKGHVWMAAIGTAQERTIAINSFSKEASVPGLRLGYACAPPQVAESLEKILQYTHLSPNSLAQFAMLKFLEDSVKDRYLNDVVIPTYRRRRDVMYSALEKDLPEAKTVLPSGAFYFFVDMRTYLEKLGREEADLASRLLEKKSVAVIPGAHFGRQGENHFRMTFVTEPEQRIVEGIKRISEYLFSYIMA